MTIRHLVRLTIVGGILASTITGPASARDRPTCRNWSAKAVESAVVADMGQRLKERPDHPFAAPFFQEHVFHRDRYRYEQHQEDVWVAPFTVTKPPDGRLAHYVAAVNCNRQVKVTGDIASP